MLSHTHTEQNRLCHCVFLVEIFGNSVVLFNQNLLVAEVDLRSYFSWEHRYIQRAWSSKVSSAEWIWTNINTLAHPHKPISPVYTVLRRAEWRGNQIGSAAGADLVSAISGVAIRNSISFHFSAIIVLVRWSKCSSSQCKCFRSVGTAVIWEVNLIISTFEHKKYF